MQGRLPVSFDLAAELGAYVVQCEFQRRTSLRSSDCLLLPAPLDCGVETLSSRYADEWKAVDLSINERLKKIQDSDIY